ncbi:MAG: CDP-glycerol glycerophosphotransferase family protein, partial [Clostridia bacterium]|nr:CDP-glycerol glycerophosphotransferase family protein [Clostridia bacterium]
MKQQLRMIFSWQMLVAIPTLLFIYLPMYACVRLFHKRRQCWLIAERRDEARDNGYVLFKWIREHHPETKVVYAIDKQSQDYNNVKDLGETVQYGSLRHWYLYLSASVCCDTTMAICAPLPMCYLIMRDILPPRNKRVFLQHGIIKDIMPYGRQHKLKADIFVCGAYPEWEFISQTYGYKKR